MQGVAHCPWTVLFKCQMALEETIGAPAGELDNMFKQYDQEDPNIEVHFSPDEIAKMSEYEKKRLRNLKRNYLVMNALGNFEIQGIWTIARFEFILGD